MLLLAGQLETGALVMVYCVVGLVFITVFVTIKVEIFSIVVKISTDVVALMVTIPLKNGL